jgi:hypothetical protein
MNRTLIALSALGLMVVGCTKSRAAAEAATETFHVRFSDGKYADIYQDGSPALHKAITEPAFVAMLQGVSRKLGGFRSASPAGWKVHTAPGGQTITLGYSSIFEKGKATETFTWTSHGEAMQLQQYNVNSQAFLLN